MSRNHDYYQISLKLLLKNKQNEFLILKVENRSKFNGFYDFPGGRIETDEFNTDIFEILKREVAEEIGLNCQYKILSDRPVGFGRHEDYSRTYQKNVRYLYLLFEAEITEGEVEISEEHTDFLWVSFETVKNNLDKLFVSGLLECAKMYFR